MLLAFWRCFPYRSRCRSSALFWYLLYCSLFTRPVAVKYFNKDRVRTNVESLIGQEAIVVSEIDNLEQAGRVTLQGKEWTARTEKNGVKIPVGSVVIVKSINGVKLIVEERKED